VRPSSDGFEVENPAHGKPNLLPAAQVAQPTWHRPEGHTAQELHSPNGQSPEAQRPEKTTTKAPQPTSSNFRKNHDRKAPWPASPMARTMKVKIVCRSTRVPCLSPAPSPPSFPNPLDHVADFVRLTAQAPAHPHRQALTFSSGPLETPHPTIPRTPSATTPFRTLHAGH
jgi:hypothetical protein